VELLWGVACLTISSVSGYSTTPLFWGVEAAMFAFRDGIRHGRWRYRVRKNLRHEGLSLEFAKFVRAPPLPNHQTSLERTTRTPSKEKNVSTPNSEDLKLLVLKPCRARGLDPPPNVLKDGPGIFGEIVFEEGALKKIGDIKTEFKNALRKYWPLSFYEQSGTEQH
jgi:hypothetical protein